MLANSQINQIDGWQILQKIGDGSFGQIFEAKRNNIDQNKQEHVAIKTQSITNVKQMLLLEYRIYCEFKETLGFPKVYDFAEKQYYSYLVMQKFDITLDSYAAKLYPKTFVPPECLLTIMFASLSLIQRLHNKGYLYRDLKPSNFMLKQPYDRLYIIDFGLSKSYLINQRHISQKQGKKLVGTPLFCSLNTHRGIEQSRRDDIECWTYTMLYLAMPLPWQTILSQNNLTKEEQYNEIGKIKQRVEWKKYIKAQNSIPNCLIQMIQVSKQIRFEEKPNYQKYYEMIKKQFQKYAGRPLPTDQKVIWECKDNKQKQIVKKKINKIKFSYKGKIQQKQSQFTGKQNIDTQIETKNPSQ